MLRGMLVVLLALSTLFGTSVAVATDAAAPPGSSRAATLLPAELTAFGDFYYSRSDGERAGFHIGTLELDVKLALDDSVSVASAVGYDAASGTMQLASFTIDGGLAGPSSKYLLRTSSLEASGIVFGKFDVPFGTAYLEYSPVDNLLVSLPGAVTATHGAWSDIGVQAYAVGRFFDAIGYWVNGPEGSWGASKADDPAARSDGAVGGRVGLKPTAGVDVGASAALALEGLEVKQSLAGLDLGARAAILDLRGEFIRRSQAGSAGEQVSGGYLRAVCHLDPFFLVARYDTVAVDEAITSRLLAGGAGVEVFPDAQIRVTGTRELEREDTAFFLHLVGGSSWQPTGLRHRLSADADD